MKLKDIEAFDKAYFAFLLTFPTRLEVMEYLDGKDIPGNDECFYLNIFELTYTIRLNFGAIKDD